MAVEKVGVVVLEGLWRIISDGFRALLVHSSGSEAFQIPQNQAFCTAAESCCPYGEHTDKGRDSLIQLLSTTWKAGSPQMSSSFLPTTWSPSNKSVWATWVAAAENQMEHQMENEMQTGMWAIYRSLCLGTVSILWPKPRTTHR